MGIKINQSGIVGIILLITAIGVFGVSIKFLVFADNQLIKVGAFQEEFSIIRTHDKYFHGDHGFVFKKSIQLTPKNKTQPYEHSQQRTQHHGNARDDEVNEESNEKIKSSHGGGRITTTAQEEITIEGDENGGEEVKLDTLESYLESLGLYHGYHGFDFKKKSIYSSIPKFKEAGIFVILTAILQIILSLFYIFWKWKTIPIMSLFFYSYFFIFLGHLTTMCVVLNHKPNRGDFKIYGYNRFTSDLFSIFLGLNCMTLLGSVIITCVRCDIDDYADRCTDRDTITTTKRSDSAANILSSATASNDRLDK